MNKIFSKIIPNKLIHTVFKTKDIQNRIDICPPEQFLQLAVLRMDKGKTFKPHKHIFKKGEENVIAQESWTVIQGSVKVFLYDLDDTIVYTDILKPGDCSITFYGGHNYEILEDNTLVYEHKTGPYKGQKLDKKFI
jgi:hypothetical protein